MDNILRLREPKTITEIMEMRFLLPIIQKEKVVEGRKASTERYKDLRIGDILHFQDEDGRTQAWCNVIGINLYYAAFGEHAIERCLKAETLARILPGVNSIAEGVGIYLGPPMSWDNDQVDKTGMLGIQIELTKTKFSI